jgi:hypothetical protein
MGMFLMGALVLGFAVGLMITGLLGTLAILLTIKSAQRRNQVWQSFAAVFAVVLALLLLVVYLYPYEHVRPGSDYDIAMKNFFMQALGYSASVGGAAFLASLATLLCPKKLPMSTEPKDYVPREMTGEEQKKAQENNRKLFLIVGSIIGLCVFACWSYYFLASVASFLSQYGK